MKKSTVEQWNAFWTKHNLESVNKITEELDTFALEGKLIVEIGAGSGTTAIDIARKGAKVVCLDYSPDAVNLIKKNSAAANTAVYPVLADAQKIPLKNEVFDFCYHQGFLEHFRDPLKMLNEQYRIIKNKGYLIVDVPQRYNIYTLTKHIKIMLNKWFAGWETEYSSRKLKRILVSAGFSPIHFFGRYHIRNIGRIQDRLLRFRIIPKFIESLYGSLIRKLENTWLGYSTAFTIGVVAQKIQK